MKKVITIVLTALLCLACNSKEDDTPSVSVNFTLIAKNNLYGAGSEGIDAQNTLITRSEDWELLISQMDSNNPISGQFSETDIDFNNDFLIAVFDEVRPSGGFYVDLKITRFANQTIVKVIRTSPDGNATTVITQPFVIAKLSNDYLPVEFQ